MPIYEYVCNKCNEVFTVLKFNTSEPTSCPKCGTSNVEKKISSFNSSCSIGGGRGFGGG